MFPFQAPLHLRPAALAPALKEALRLPLLRKKGFSLIATHSKICNHVSNKHNSNIKETFAFMLMATASQSQRGEQFIVSASEPISFYAVAYSCFSQSINISTPFLNSSTYPHIVAILIKPII
jgi:hypothetical protein